MWLTVGLPVIWLTFSLPLLAACLPQARLQFYAQQAYVHRQLSLWQIAEKSPYRMNNGYSDIGVSYHNRCQIIDNQLDAEFTLVGLAYYPWQTPGNFEKDNQQLRSLLQRFSISYLISDTLSLTAGKFSTPSGLFYTRSPMDLLHNGYAGFKTGKIYDPGLQEAYSETLWGAKLSQETLDYSWSLTLAPQLTRIRKRYQSSSSWSALERSNARERYLLTWTDYRLPGHTPSVSLLVGASRTLAVADSFRPAPQWTVNAELAWHDHQQWRHFSGERAGQIQHYNFPSSLYQRGDRDGMELALSGQYTSDGFSQFGMEYYFQSEGYTRKQWRRQVNFIGYLNQRTGYQPLDSAHDNYKYLMAAEINNSANHGYLQGRHYLTGYASLMMEEGASVRGYGVMNMQDNSTMLGIHFNKPLTQAEGKIDIYSGIYRTQGSRNAEFSLFGNTTGIYSGFKYYF